MSNAALSAVVLLLLLATGTAQVRVKLTSWRSREGRLQVYYNNTWGTVCDDSFNVEEARVVCHMLGHGYVGHDIGNRYGAGTGQIWLDEVHCSGTETNIADCQHRGWGVHDCDHTEDVSVSCFNEVRLVGDSGSRGRLEVYHNGTWGTVCDNGFTDEAAEVVCFMLGYGRTGKFIGNTFGGGSGQIWLDNVRCYDNDLTLTQCQHSDWGRHNCSHSNDVSITRSHGSVRVL